MYANLSDCNDGINAIGSSIGDSVSPTSNLDPGVYGEGTLYTYYFKQIDRLNQSSSSCTSDTYTIDTTFSELSLLVASGTSIPTDVTTVSSTSYVGITKELKFTDSNAEADASYAYFLNATNCSAGFSGGVTFQSGVALTSSSTIANEIMDITDEIVHDISVLKTDFINPSSCKTITFRFDETAPSKPISISRTSDSIAKSASAISP